MENFVKLTAICAIGGLLTGCNGSSTALPTVSYATLSTDAAAMQAKYTDASGRLLPTTTKATAADVRSAADATYTGYVAGNVAGSNLVGEVSIDTDFTAQTTSSTATGFVHETAGAYAGTLSGTGVISPNPPVGLPQMSTTVTGNLTNGGTTYATTIGMEGDFVANAGDPVGAIAGIADGTVGGVLFTGTFATEK